MRSLYVDDATWDAAKKAAGRADLTLSEYVRAVLSADVGTPFLGPAKGRGGPWRTVKNPKRNRRKVTK